MQLAVRHADGIVTAASGSFQGRHVTDEDTFNFGSGTKPVTAVAVFRLIESGAIAANDKASSIVDPFLLRFNDTTLSKLFGDGVSNASVMDLLRMSSGIPDFEFGNFDSTILNDSAKGFVDYPFEALRYVADRRNLSWSPGTGAEYSSTGYEVAGLVLAAVLKPDRPWYEMDLGAAALPNRSRYPSMSFPPVGSQLGVVSDFITVPGIITDTSYGGGYLYDQNPSVLGWTCGNLVGTTRDVAQFFYDLLHPDSDHPLVSPRSRDEMTTFQLMTSGWASGWLNYGAGLIQRDITGNEWIGPLENPGRWGFDVGHKGNTYGTVTSQGYLESLGLAYSVASNIDGVVGSLNPTDVMTCRLHEVVIEVLGGEPIELGCEVRRVWLAGSPIASILLAFIVLCLALSIVRLGMMPRLKSLQQPLLP